MMNPPPNDPVLLTRFNGTGSYLREGRKNTSPTTCYTCCESLPAGLGYLVPEKDILEKRPWRRGRFRARAPRPIVYRCIDREACEFRHSLWEWKVKAKDMALKYLEGKARKKYHQGRLSIDCSFSCLVLEEFGEFQSHTLEGGEDFEAFCTENKEFLKFDKWAYGVGLLGTPEAVSRILSIWDSKSPNGIFENDWEEWKRREYLQDEGNIIQWWHGYGTTLSSEFIKLREEAYRVGEVQRREMAFRAVALLDRFRPLDLDTVPHVPEEEASEVLSEE